MFLVFFIFRLIHLFMHIGFGLIDPFSFLGPLLYQLVEVDKISIYERRACFPFNIQEMLSQGEISILYSSAILRMLTDVRLCMNRVGYATEA